MLMVFNASCSRAGQIINNMRDLTFGYRPHHLRKVKGGEHKALGGMHRVHDCVKKTDSIYVWVSAFIEALSMTKERRSSARYREFQVEFEPVWCASRVYTCAIVGCMHNR